MRKFMLLGSILIVFILLCTCAKENAAPDPDIDEQDPPALSWPEDWFEHRQIVKLQDYTKYVALYYDDDMDTAITWPARITSQIWKYSWNTYGGFGEDNRLKVVLHADKYFGGHPAYYLSASHGYNNVVDIGLNKNAWSDSTGQALDILAHEIGHIVESCAYQTLESPAFSIWGDSKWMEIYQYDLYKGIGLSEKAESWHNRMLGQTDDFPRANTHWYKDWFYPIYKNHGQAKVLNNFFKMLSENFPTEPISGGKKYTRNMNMGEFVHFWSAAAGKDLREIAVAAFGTKDKNGQDWFTQLEKAKVDFAKLKY